MSQLILIEKLALDPKLEPASHLHFLKLSPVQNLKTAIKKPIDFRSALMLMHTQYAFVTRLKIISILYQI